jgi:hypothetical protein
MAPVVAAAMKVSSNRKIFKCAGAVEAIVPVKNKTDCPGKKEKKIKAVSKNIQINKIK